jgi:hypothetical protein
VCNNWVNPSRVDNIDNSCNKWDWSTLSTLLGFTQLLHTGNKYYLWDWSTLSTLLGFTQLLHTGYKYYFTNSRFVLQLLRNMGREFAMIHEVFKIDSIDSVIGKTKMKERFVVLWLLVRQDWFRNLKFIHNSCNKWDWSILSTLLGFTQLFHTG